MALSKHADKRAALWVGVFAAISAVLSALGIVLAGGFPGPKPDSPGEVLFIIAAIMTFALVFIALAIAYGNQSPTSRARSGAENRVRRDWPSRAGEILAGSPFQPGGWSLFSGEDWNEKKKAAKQHRRLPLSGDGGALLALLGDLAHGGPSGWKHWGEKGSLSCPHCAAPADIGSFVGIAVATEPDTLNTVQALGTLMTAGLRPRDYTCAPCGKAIQYRLVHPSEDPLRYKAASANVSGRTATIYDWRPSPGSRETA